MPTAYAKLLISVNGGADQSGSGLTVSGGDALHLSGENPGYWEHGQFEIYAWPEGWTAPMGWTLQTGAEGSKYVYYSVGGATPPDVTVPNIGTFWGKWLARLVVNDGLRNGAVDATLTDESMGWQTLSPTGLRGFASQEQKQFGGDGAWATEMDRDMHAIDAAIIGGVAVSGLTGLVPPLSPTLQPGQLCDFDSLVPGDLAQEEWQPMSGGGTAPVVRANAAQTSDGYMDGLVVNSPNDSGTFVLETAFATPSGMTAVAFELDAKLPPGVLSSTVMLQITSIDRGTTLHQTACVLSSSFQTFTTGAVTVSPNTFYIARVVMGTGLASNPAAALVGEARVKPTTASDSFYTSGFIRYGAMPAMLWDNGREGLSADGLPDIVPAPRCSAYARMVFRTNAAKIAVQAFNSITTVIGGDEQMLVVVNGRPFTYVSGASDVHDVSVVTLPAGLKTVEVVSSLQAQVTGSAETYGSKLLSVLAPKDAIFEVVPPPQAAQRLLVVGDSKSCGAGASVPALNGWQALIRRGLPSTDIVSEAASSKQFFDEAATDAGLIAFAGRLAKYKPTKLLIDLGRNDQDASAYPVATFQTRYGMFLDAFHGACPECAVYLLASFPETTEAANGFGDVLQDYRNAVEAIADARTWATFLDSTTIPGYVPASATADGIHPNDAGAVLVATWLLPELRTPPSQGDLRDAVYHKNFGSDADVTLDVRESSYGSIVLHDLTPVLTTTRNVILTIPEGRSVRLFNTAKFSLVAKLASGSGVAVPAGGARVVVSDGSAIVSAVAPVDGIESLVTNLALYSEDFSNGAYGTDLCTISAHTGSAPPTGLSAAAADEIVASTSATATRDVYQTGLPGAREVEVWIKPGTLSWAAVALVDSSGPTIIGLAWFHLSGGGTAGGILTDDSIVAGTTSAIVADGSFYRCKLTLPCFVDVADTVVIYPTNGDATFSSTATSGDHMLQVIGLRVDDAVRTSDPIYVKTEGTARRAYIQRQEPRADFEVFGRDGDLRTYATRGRSTSSTSLSTLAVVSDCGAVPGRSAGMYRVIAYYIGEKDSTTGYCGTYEELVYWDGSTTFNVIGSKLSGEISTSVAPAFVYAASGGVFTDVTLKGTPASASATKWSSAWQIQKQTTA